jgi:hypothetical protein
VAYPTRQQAVGTLLKLAQLRKRGIALTRHLDDPAAAADLENIIRSVALRPGADRLEVAVAIGYALEAACAHGTLRRLAAMIACTHPVTDLVGILTDSELRSVTLHECVLRGNDFRGGLHGHPLAVLPPTLLDCERRIAPASYSASGVGHSLPFGPSRAAAPTYDPPAHALQPARSSMARHLASPFATWLEQSNATVDAYIFEFDAPQDVSTIHPDNLRTLGVGSMAGLQALRPTSLDAVCAQLFAAAAYGGAHDIGLGGGYGRLTMWQSVAALAGVPFTTIEHVSAHAAECTWWYFDGTPWFNAVAWDIGLIALRNDRRSMAVLAATDSD